MNYKFEVGELVKVDHTGDLGLVTGLVPGPVTPAITRYTVLIQGVTCKLHGYTLRKAGE